MMTDSKYAEQNSVFFTRDGLESPSSLKRDVQNRSPCRYTYAAAAMATYGKWIMKDRISSSCLSNDDENTDMMMMIIHLREEWLCYDDCSATRETTMRNENQTPTPE